MKKIVFSLFLIGTLFLNIDNAFADDDAFSQCYDDCYTSNMTSDQCTDECRYLLEDEAQNEVIDNIIDNSSNNTDNSGNVMGSRVQCGDFKIPTMFATITSTVITVLTIATPIIIILLGSLDLLKAVIAQKEDDIKKGQQTFIRRLIVGALVFLVFFIVQVVIGFVAPRQSNEGMWNCVDCLINGDCN